MHEFSDLGFTVKHRALNEPICQLLNNHWRHSSDYDETDSPKDAWQRDRLLFDVATDQALVDPVCALLDDKVHLWGACFLHRKPGQIHRWHCDVETMHASGFVSVWIGLKGTDEGSALRVIPRSHLYGRSLQEEQLKLEDAGDMWDEDAVIALARRVKTDAQIEVPNLTDGDALIFNGRLWHGSNNQSSGDRLAMLIQYARHDAVVKKKRRGPVTIPVDFEPTLPKVFPIGSDATAVKNPVARAPANGTYSDRILKGEFRQLDLPLMDNSKNGWKPYDIAKGASPNVGSMSVHASTLAPGKSPHPPHCHLDEEILLILDGEADIILCDDPAGSNTAIHRMKPGIVAFYPPYQHHTIVNNSNKAVNYLMFRWSGNPCHLGVPLDCSTFNFSFLEADAKRQKRKFRAARIFEDQTHFLEKLECHRTILDPGGGYASHSDEHDVAIIVFAGEVAVNGQTAGRGGVFYIAAGTPHDMQNAGPETAHYLVLEFHALKPELGRMADTGGRIVKDGRKRKSLASRAARRLRKFLRRLAKNRA